MKVRIYSAIAARVNRERPPENKREETWEGDVPEMTLEEIFRFFNRVDQADCDRLEELGYRLPSLSVNDIVTVDGISFSVEDVGFQRLES